MNENNKKKRAILQGADLMGADLRGTNLRGAILRDCDLRGVNLMSADLCGADFINTPLTGTYLRGANLQSANLRGADLCGANLMDADLRGADLRDVDLKNAYTHGIKTDAETKINWPMKCPKTGSFIGWKKAGRFIIKLEIPEEAERSSATTNKCRSSMATVLEILNMDGTMADVTEIMTDLCWIYKVGEMVYPDKWDDNRWNECSHGIHFFMTREEAVAW